MGYCYARASSQVSALALGPGGTLRQSSRAAHSGLRRCRNRLRGASVVRWRLLADELLTQFGRSCLRATLSRHTGTARQPAPKEDAASVSAVLAASYGGG